jgi:nucleotide-binding universal stress UspA family protein
MYRNILVPTDGSDTATRGVQEAIQLAQALSGRIRLLHVVNTAPRIAPGPIPVVIDDLVTQWRSAGESILHEAMTAVRSAGVEVDDRLIESLGDRTGEVVLDEARDWPANLIVCGTHGRRGLKRIVMGSDAEYIVRHSIVPVLLIRAQGTRD